MKALDGYHDARPRKVPPRPRGTGKKGTDAWIMSAKFDLRRETLTVSLRTPAKAMAAAAASPPPKPRRFPSPSSRKRRAPRRTRRRRRWRRPEAPRRRKREPPSRSKGGEANERRSVSSSVAFSFESVRRAASDGGGTGETSGGTAPTTARASATTRRAHGETIVRHDETHATRFHTRLDATARRLARRRPRSSEDVDKAKSAAIVRRVPPSASPRVDFPPPRSPRSPRSFRSFRSFRSSRTSTFAPRSVFASASRLTYALRSPLTGAFFARPEASASRASARLRITLATTRVCTSAATDAETAPTSTSGSRYAATNARTAATTTGDPGGAADAHESRLLVVDSSGGDARWVDAGARSGFGFADRSRLALVLVLPVLVLPVRDVSVRDGAVLATRLVFSRRRFSRGEDRNPRDGSEEGDGSFPRTILASVNETVAAASLAYPCRSAPGSGSRNPATPAAGGGVSSLLRAKPSLGKRHRVLHRASIGDAQTRPARSRRRESHHALLVRALPLGSRFGSPRSVRNAVLVPVPVLVLVRRLAERGGG